MQEEQGIELAGVEHDGLAGDQAEQREQRDLGVAPAAERFRQRRARDAAARLHALEGRRFGELEANPQRQRQQREGDEERESPGVVGKVLLAWALVFGAAFFVFFGWLSDRVGRKPIILVGCLLAALAYIPVFKQISNLANPALARAIDTVKVSIVADPAQCGSLFNPVGTRVLSTSCDLVRQKLAETSVRYVIEPAPGSKTTIVRVDGKDLPFDAARPAETGAAIRAALHAAGYPRADDPGIVRMSGLFDVFRAQTAGLIGLLFVLVLFVTMVYGPLAAALVELFPTRIRYTSVSLPYHIGNGWFGGLLPAISFAMVAQTGDIYYGLWYPIVVAIMTALVGMVFIPETKNRDIYLADDKAR